MKNSILLVFASLLIGGQAFGQSSSIPNGHYSAINDFETSSSDSSEEETLPSYLNVTDSNGIFFKFDMHLIVGPGTRPSCSPYGYARWIDDGFVGFVQERTSKGLRPVDGCKIYFARSGDQVNIVTAGSRCDKICGNGEISEFSGQFRVPKSK